MVTVEAARILQRLGAEVQIYNPTGLPVPDATSADHQKVRELRSLSLWSEAHVGCSPERHGAVTDVMKAQIDWLAVTQDNGHPVHGRTLAVGQISGGAQNFNRVSQMRVFGRWMRIVTTPLQTTIAEAVAEFDETGRMKASPYYNRIVDMMEELMKFTLPRRDRSAYLTDRYSDRAECAREVAADRVNPGPV